MMKFVKVEPGVPTKFKAGGKELSSNTHQRSEKEILEISTGNFDVYGRLSEVGQSSAAYGWVGVELVKAAVVHHLQ